MTTTRVIALQPSFLEVDGKQLIDPGVIPAGSMNSSVYDQVKPGVH